MSGRGRELLDELKSVISGKTLDAILPPLFFAVINNIYSLNTALFSAIAAALVLGFVRLILHQTWKYAFGGLAGVVVASGFAYLAGNASNYFLPGVISSLLFLIAALASLVIGKPIAAWVSHLSRGWDLQWFWRKDIKPAYIEVTWFWAGFFLIRLIIQVVLLLRENILHMALAKALLGLPFTVVILVLSYLYGIWRLRKLGGPGIEEFKAGKESPWKGQTRGF